MFTVQIDTLSIYVKKRENLRIGITEWIKFQNKEKDSRIDNIVLLESETNFYYQPSFDKIHRKKRNKFENNNNKAYLARLAPIGGSCNL